MVEALTTIDKVKSTAPELVGSLSDDTLTTFIEDASLQVVVDRFPEAVRVGNGDVDIRELAARYLACHLASMDTPGAKGVTSEQVDVIRRTYADKTASGWLNSSIWGQLYLRLYEQYAGGGVRHYAHIQH